MVNVYWLALVLVAGPLVVGGADYSDLPGPYCEARRGGCCDGRIDNCAQPILGTLCYCDEFCNRTRNEDCCPDFWSFCKGITPPPKPPTPITLGCLKGGKFYGQGETIKVNCNECKCDTMQGVPEFLCEQQECLIDPQQILDVNRNRDVGWTASNYTNFWGRFLQDGVKLRLGTLQPHNAVLRMTPVKRQYDARRLPTAFDARQKWRGLMQEISDQGWCGASWAMSTASVASDRFAVMTNGTERVTLAANQLLACNNRAQRGCGGGHLDRAWIYMRKHGLVEENCFPYVAKHGHPGTCRIPKRGATQLSLGCPAPSNPASTRKDLYRMGPAYKMGSVEDIMYEIYHSGPVQATMKVYRDFFSYRGGIYQTTLKGAGHRTGYHSVRIIGWGEENTAMGPVKYWMLANSWGPNWGENGYFRIRRGSNECEIEQFVLASWAQESRTIRHLEGNNLINNEISRIR